MSIFSRHGHCGNKSLISDFIFISNQRCLDDCLILHFLILESFVCLSVLLLFLLVFDRSGFGLWAEDTRDQLEELLQLIRFADQPSERSDLLSQLIELSRQVPGLTRCVPHHTLLSTYVIHEPLLSNDHMGPAVQTTRIHSQLSIHAHDLTNHRG